MSGGNPKLNPNWGWQQVSRAPDISRRVGYYISGHRCDDMVRAAATRPFCYGGLLGDFRGSPPPVPSLCALLALLVHKCDEGREPTSRLLLPSFCALCACQSPSAAPSCPFLPLEPPARLPRLLLLPLLLACPFDELDPWQHSTRGVRQPYRPVGVAVARMVQHSSMLFPLNAFLCPRWLLSTG